MATGNVNVICGLDAMLNPNNIKSDMTVQDLRNLEKSMIEGGLIEKKTDPQNKFEAELMAVSRRLGIPLGAKAEKVVEATSSYREDIREDIRDYRDDNRNDDTRDDEAQESLDDIIDDIAEEIEDEPINTKYVRDISPKRSIYEDLNRPKYSSVAPMGSATSSGISSSMQQPYQTKEEMRRSQINSVIGASENDNFLEVEKMEDRKQAMLSEIEILISSLKEEEVDLSRIPNIDQTSGYDLVHSVLMALRRKSDHSRYCTFAEEFILFGAYALEAIFDGERVFFGKYRPNLKGWHNHVNVKLPRMRVDTGAIVSSLMQDHGISPAWRVLAELVPNCILYSYTRSQSFDQQPLYSATTVQKTTDDLRGL